MDGLFSHAAQGAAAGTEPTALGDRAASCFIALPPTQVFDAFTDLIHLWWPLAEYSAFGAESHVEFDDGRLIEEALDGRQFLWASVLSWQPSELKLDWFLGSAAGLSTVVCVTFSAKAEGCELVLRQNGWENGPVGQEQYEKYRDWPQIVGKFARFMGA